jgi:hypothetical protein
MKHLNGPYVVLESVLTLTLQLLFKYSLHSLHTISIFVQHLSRILKMRMERFNVSNILNIVNRFQNKQYQSQ